jgi:hypothetical protein
MTKRIELPPEATLLIEQIEALEARLHNLRDEFKRDTANARAAIETELRRLFQAQGQSDLLGPPSTHLETISGPHVPATPGGGDEQRNAETQLRSLKDQVAALEERRDALLEEGRRRLLAEHEERVAAFDADRRQEEERARRTAEYRKAKWDRADAELKRDREAFEAAAAARPFELTGLVAEIWADYERAQTALLMEELVKRPAMRAAEIVRQKGRELAEARRRAVRAEWVALLYEDQVPWLVELRDYEQEQSYVEAGDELPDVDVQEADDPSEEGEVDPVRRWLTKEEWLRLPPSDRNQRALDNYFAGRRTSWQLGRDYERYVGYLRETDGYEVTYQGMIAGLEDMGRDLIAMRGNNVEVIQCKRWSQQKTIHEKHLFQLYGTCVYAALDYPAKTITASFVTTTKLSDLAKRVAAHLEIRVIEQFPIAPYPAIKCNVGRDGERIYHLPFDQQYDKTIVHRDRGEFWAATVAEAEAAGFRRAYRWHSVGG